VIMNWIVYLLYRVSEMYVADESHTDGRIEVQIDIVLSKMQCSCKILRSQLSVTVVSTVW